MTPPTEEENDFDLVWTASDGSWLFILEADTADLRVEMISAFTAFADRENWEQSSGG
jgi:hypothetical protein